VPPENPEVIEEVAIDSAVSMRPSLDKLSSLWTLRDRVAFFPSFGGVPTWRSVLAFPVNLRDKAVILVDGEVERWNKTESIRRDIRKLKITSASLWLYLVDFSA
jgi:hypothetical protein